MLQPGDRVGDWVVDARIGEGGMGAVFRCHSTLSSAMKAAVKVLKASEVSQGRERFVQELQTLAALSHPGVVRVLGGGEDSARDLLFLVMELVEGEPLSARLEKGPLPPGDAVELVRRLAESLAYVHASGVFHRDVKPSNVMISAVGPRLIDFGIARASSRNKLTVAGTVTGTMAYLPPESFQVEDPEPALADVYALGITLHEALTCAHPFGDDTTSSASLGRLVALKLGSKPMDPGPAFGQDLRDLVQAATSPDPQSRTPSMAAFAEALGALGIEATRPAPAARPPMTVSARKAAEPSLEVAPPPKPEPARPEPASPQPGPTAPSSKPDSPLVASPNAPSGKGVGVALLLGVAAVGLLAMAGLGVIGLVGFGGVAAFLGTHGPPERTLQVVIDGASPDRVSFEGQPMAREATGWVLPLTLSSSGTVRAVSGPGAETWSGGACPPCAACVEQSVTVSAGEGAQVLALRLEPPAAIPRDVVLRAPSVPEPAVVAFTLDGQPAVGGARDSATFPAGAPGRHLAVASTGACTPADEGCTAKGACSRDCASVAMPVEVECGEGPLEASLPLAPPGAPPLPLPTPAPSSRPAPGPAPAPVVAPAPEPAPPVQPEPAPEPEPAPSATQVTFRLIAPAASAGVRVMDASGEVQQVNTNTDVTVLAGKVLLQHGYSGPTVTLTVEPGARRVVCGTIDSCTVK